MSAKTILNQWLASGEDQRVADALGQLARQWGDKYFNQEVVHQTGRLNTLKKERNRGVLDDRYYNQQLNAIRLALQDLIERLPDTLTLAQDTADTAGTSTESPEVERRSVPPHVPWIVGLLLLAGAVGVLMWFGPCPSKTVGNLTQLLMALGAGGVATLLPGIFNLKFKGMEAGSAIGFAALVYLINPAGVVNGGRGCAEFVTVTVAVHGAQGIHEKILIDGEVFIAFPQKTEEATIDKNGEAIFRKIPAEWLQERVRIYLEHPQPYQSLHPDSLYQIPTEGKVYVSAGLQHADRLFGTITDASNNAFLDSVRVNIRHIETYTNQYGWFELHIPADLQMKFQRVTLSKSGYESATFDSVPVHTRQEFSYALSRAKKRKK